jgi:hypothetical protein
MKWFLHGYCRQGHHQWEVDIAREEVARMREILQTSNRVAIITWTKANFVAIGPIGQKME